MQIPKPNLIFNSNPVILDIGPMFGRQVCSVYPAIK